MPPFNRNVEAIDRKLRQRGRAMETYKGAGGGNFSGYPGGSNDQLSFVGQSLLRECTKRGSEVPRGVHLSTSHSRFGSRADDYHAGGLPSKDRATLAGGPGKGS